MTHRPLLVALAFGFAVLTGSSSWAATGATVVPSQGTVLVNKGSGFNQIKKPVKLRVGNSVMVGPEGSALVAYGDGCQVNVKPGAVTTIAALSPCASGASAESDKCPWNNDNKPCYWQDGGYQNYAFWAAFGSGLGFIIYNIISP
jgi:hypothetical protein